VIDLLRKLQRDHNLAYIFISHDLAVVKHIATRIAVMYLGRIVESAPSDQLFAEPRHPYTQALLSAIPQLSAAARRERRILPGDPPSPIAPPPGCHLHPRCPHAVAICHTEQPLLVAEAPDQRGTACHRWRDIVSSGRIGTPAEAEFSPRLERLFKAFEGRT
jgi:peptide/nickel transport system ATP-binding protein/oligopeptide transport system ATP-binding protein